jgi:hypothetical protein
MFFLAGNGADVWMIGNYPPTTTGCGSGGDLGHVQQNTFLPPGSGGYWSLTCPWGFTPWTPGPAVQWISGPYPTPKNGYKVTVSGTDFGAIQGTYYTNGTKAYVTKSPGYSAPIMGGTRDLYLCTYNVNAYIVFCTTTNTWVMMGTSSGSGCAYVNPFGSSLPIGTTVWNEPGACWGPSSPATVVYV